MRKKENKATVSHSSANTSKAVDKKTDKDETLTTSEITPVQEETTQSSADYSENIATNNQGQEPIQSSSSIDVDALANNDYSSISGTWSNDLGETLTIASDGKIQSSAYEPTQEISDGDPHDKVFFAHIGAPNLPGGAAFIVIPSSIPNPQL